MSVNPLLTLPPQQDLKIVGKQVHDLSEDNIENLSFSQMINQMYNGHEIEGDFNILQLLDDKGEVLPLNNLGLHLGSLGTNGEWLENKLAKLVSAEKTSLLGETTISKGITTTVDIPVLVGGPSSISIPISGEGTSPESIIKLNDIVSAQEAGLDISLEISLDKKNINILEDLIKGKSDVSDSKFLADSFTHFDKRAQFTSYNVSSEIYDKLSESRFKIDNTEVIEASKSVILPDMIETYDAQVRPSMNQDITSYVNAQQINALTGKQALHSESLNQKLLVNSGLSEANWGEEMGTRLIWMVNKNQQSAQIYIDPPELGPIDVRVNVRDGEANVVFTTSQNAVKEALELSLPRMKEMLENNGFTSTHVNVESNTSGQRQMANHNDTKQNNLSEHMDDLSAENGIDAPPDNEEALKGYISNLVDHYV